MSIEETLDKGKVGEIKKELNVFLEKLTSQKSKMAAVDQNKAKSLIMDIIHSVAVIDDLIATRTKNIREWPWFKQLKYSFNRKTKLCDIFMCKADFRYSYEYQGNPAKLVHTPLTDKCY